MFKNLISFGEILNKNIHTTIIIIIKIPLYTLFSLIYRYDSSYVVSPSTVNVIAEFSIFQVPVEESTCSQTVPNRFTNSVWLNTPFTEYIAYSKSFWHSSSNVISFPFQLRHHHYLNKR